MYTIYKITNLTNGKIYIGITTKTINERLNAHYYNRNSNHRPIYVDMMNIDICNWTIEEIDSCSTKNEASRLEKYYISINNSTDRDIGYNISVGGVGDTLTNNPNIHNISKKISASKIGRLNHNSKAVELDIGFMKIIIESAELCRNYIFKNYNINVASSTIKRKCNGVIKDNRIGDFKVRWFCNYTKV